MKYKRVRALIYFKLYYPAPSSSPASVSLPRARLTYERLRVHAHMLPTSPPFASVSTWRHPWHPRLQQEDWGRLPQSTSFLTKSRYCSMFHSRGVLSLLSPVSSPPCVRCCRRRELLCGSLASRLACLSVERFDRSKLSSVTVFWWRNNTFFSTYEFRKNCHQARRTFSQDHSC